MAKEETKTEKKTEKQGQPEAPKKGIEEKKAGEDIRGIVRVLDSDLAGKRKLYTALPKVKGVGKTLARAIPRAVGIDENMLAGTLTDEQVSELEAALRDPASVGIPVHMLNRRGDRKSGEDKHLTESSLIITKKFDIDRLRRIHSYRGKRHQAGLPVRGQRTRGSFRTGQTTGVVRTKVQKGGGGEKK